jgi:small subunit ribosomal protein S20
MPNIKSSKKSVRTDRIKQVSNKSYLSKVKNDMKKIEKAVKDNDKELASSILKTTIADIDKCASKGLLKQNTADRQKARLNKKVKDMK